MANLKKIGRLLKFIFALAILLLLAGAQSTEEPWRTAYADLLRRNADTIFALYDMDADGIPEMILATAGHGWPGSHYHHYFYTFDSTGLRVLGEIVITGEFAGGDFAYTIPYVQDIRGLVLTAHRRYEHYLYTLHNGVLNRQLVFWNLWSAFETGSRVYVVKNNRVTNRYYTSWQTNDGLTGEILEQHIDPGFDAALARINGPRLELHAVTEANIQNEIHNRWAPPPAAPAPIPSPRIHVPQGGMLAASNLNSLAIRDDGSLWTQGRNQYGQVGDGTMTYYRSHPAMIMGSMMLPPLPLEEAPAPDAPQEEEQAPAQAAPQIEPQEPPFLVFPWPLQE